MDIESAKNLKFFNSFKKEYVEELFNSKLKDIDLNKPKYLLNNLFKQILNLDKSKCFSKKFWIDRGWSEEEAVIKVSLISKKGSDSAKLNSKNKPHSNSPMKIEFWINKGMTLEEAKFKTNSFRKFKKEYWINKGFSEEEAILKVSEFQKNNSSKLVKKRKENPERYSDVSDMQLKYWLKKGFSEEEAKSAVKERQQTFTLEKCIQRHGKEEGTKKWKERQEKWQNTLNSKSKEEKVRINKSKAVTINSFVKKYGEEEGKRQYLLYRQKTVVPFCKASKTSLKIFIPIYKFLRNNNISRSDIYLGVNGSKEYFIRNGVNFYSYDFVVKSKKIIIEFHGSKFHPNYEKLNELEIKNWKSAYKAEGPIVKEKDDLKKQVAIDNNFLFIELYEEDGIEYNINKSLVFIKGILNES